MGEGKEWVDFSGMLRGGKLPQNLERCEDED
jgi:hypothetical protein